MKLLSFLSHVVGMAMVFMMPTVWASNEPNYDKEEAFIRLVLENKAEPILQALKDGANINQMTGTGQSILCAVSMLGKTTAARVLIEQGAELRDECLVNAVVNGHADITSLYLDRGKSPDLVANENGDRLLHMAVRNTHVQVTRLLLERGANRELENKAGETPYDVLRQHRRKVRRIESLLKAPAAASL